MYRSLETEQTHQLFADYQACVEFSEARDAMSDADDQMLYSVALESEAAKNNGIIEEDVVTSSAASNNKKEDISDVDTTLSNLLSGSFSESDKEDDNNMVVPSSSSVSDSDGEADTTKVAQKIVNKKANDMNVTVISGDDESGSVDSELRDLLSGGFSDTD